MMNITTIVFHMGCRHTRAVKATQDVQGAEEESKEMFQKCEAIGQERDYASVSARVLKTLKNR